MLMEAIIRVSGKSNFTWFTDVDEKYINLDDHDTSFIYNLIAKKYPDNNWEDMQLTEMMLDNVKNTYVIHVNVW